MENNPTKTLVDLQKKDPSFDFSKAYVSAGPHGTYSLVMVFVRKVTEHEISSLTYFVDGQKVTPKNTLFCISSRNFTTEYEVKLSFIWRDFWSTQESVESAVESYLAKRYESKFRKLNSQKEILDFVNKTEEDE